MIGRGPSVEDLHAYHDGELRGIAGWRVRRWLARSGAARRELEILARSAEWIREADRTATAAPDLWEVIGARLPSIDAQRRSEAQGPWRLAWPAGAVAAVAAAAALAFLLLWPQTESTYAVRSLDTDGRPVMVLEGEATIIWLIDAPPPDVSREDSRGVV